MRPISLLRGIPVLVPLIACAQAQDTKVITGATLIDGTGGAPIQNAVIVIEGTRITQVGASDKTTIPKGAHMIDARGKFVIPGLADMHNHLGNGYERPGPGKRHRTSAKPDPVAGVGLHVRSMYLLRRSSVGGYRQGRRRTAFPVMGCRIAKFFDGGRAYGTNGINLPKTSEEAREQVRRVGPSAGLTAIKILYSDNSHRRQIDSRPPLPVMKREIMLALIEEAHKMNMKPMFMRRRCATPGRR